MNHWQGPPQNYFDRGKAFYPLIVHYVAQLVGFKELFVRGFSQGNANQEGIDDLRRRIQENDRIARDARTQILEDLEKLVGPLQLRCETDDSHITIDPDVIPAEFVQNCQYLISYVMVAAGHLLIVAYETTKDQPSRDQGPLWEFLRHCRHAAAHGGFFNFLGKEPRHVASWAGLEITRELQGVPLFRRQAQSGMIGLLSPGDPIRLLWDIEQAYPDLVPPERYYEHLR